MDITNLMNDYRECARSIWNAFLLDRNASNDNWDTIDQFDRICSILFNIIILKPINHSSHFKSLSNEQYPNPLLFLKIIPSPQTNVSIMINRDMKASGYWDYPLNLADKVDLDLRFIDYFDFNLQGFRDFEYYRVRVVGSSQHTDIIGRDALIRSNHAVVALEEAESEK